MHQESTSMEKKIYEIKGTIKSNLSCAQHSNHKYFNPNQYNIIAESEDSILIIGGDLNSRMQDYNYICKAHITFHIKQIFNQIIVI